MPRMVLLMLVVFGFGVAKIKWNYGCYCRSRSVLHSFSAVFRLLRDRGSWSLKPSWATLISSRRLLYWTPARAVLISYASSGWVSVKLRLLCLPQFTTSVKLIIVKFLNWPLDLCSTQFSQPPPVNHLTCTTQQQSSILISFLKVRLNFYYFWKDTTDWNQMGKFRRFLKMNKKYGWESFSKLSWQFVL